jgi:hypothetical protein
MQTLIRCQTFALSSLVLCAGLAASLPVQARNGLSALSDISPMPVASVVIGASVVSASVVVLPAVLLAQGAELVVKAVEVSARGTVYLLERASDGARVSVEVLGRVAAGASLAAGAVVTVSVIGSGVVLSAAGEAIAYIPNAIGQALLHNERITQ